MNKEIQLLDLFYELTNKNTTTLPFTEYTEIIKKKLNLPIDNILDLFSSLLEKGYLRNTSLDRLFLTEKGIKEVTFKDIVEKLSPKDLNFLLSTMGIK